MLGGRGGGGNQILVEHDSVESNGTNSWPLKSFGAEYFSIQWRGFSAKKYFSMLRMRMYEISVSLYIFVKKKKKKSTSFSLNRGVLFKLVHHTDWKTHTNYIQHVYFLCAISEVGQVYRGTTWPSPFFLFFSYNPTWFWGWSSKFHEIWRNPSGVSKCKKRKSTE